MITANKVFKGSTEIIRIYKGSTLEWEKAIDVPTYSWNPTTYIGNSGYHEVLGRRETGSVTLTLPPNVGVVQNELYFSTANPNQEDHYIKEYVLDSASTVKCSLDWDGRQSTRSLYCTQYPGNAEVHTIYFKAYGGYYAYRTTFEASNPRLIYHPSQIQSTYTKKTILFNTSGVWTFYIDNSSADDSDNWTSDFQIQGAGTYRLKFTLTSGLEDGEYASCKFYICDLDSDTINQTLTVQYNTGGSTKTATIDFKTSDDNRHTIKIGGQYSNWGKYTAKIEVSAIVHS